MLCQALIFRSWGNVVGSEGTTEGLRAANCLSTSIEIVPCFNTWHSCTGEYQRQP